jgi:predicted Rossmann-fold nucleotide-binding protein
VTGGETTMMTAAMAAAVVAGASCLGIVLAAEYKHADHCKAEKNLHHLD